jgi:hypothetical protein
MDYRQKAHDDNGIARPAGAWVKWTANQPEVGPWSDLDHAPLPNFDSNFRSELIDDEADTIFECKKPQFEYSECLLFDNLHWLNDLDELDKTLDNYQNRLRFRVGTNKCKKPPVTTKRAATRQSHWHLTVHFCVILWTIFTKHHYVKQSAKVSHLFMLDVSLCFLHQ